MAEAKTPKKVGRPPKESGAGRRATLTFRPPEPLHERLKLEAAKADRSVSEEVERSVERYYDIQDNHSNNTKELIQVASDVVRKIFNETVGGKHNFNAGQSFAKALDTYQKEADAKFRAEDPWYIDADKRKYVKDKAKDIVDFIVDRLVFDLDPEAEERRRASWPDTPLARLGEGYSFGMQAPDVRSPEQPAAPSEKPKSNE